MMKSTAEAIIRHRWLILIATALLTGFFAYQITNLEVDSNVVNALPESDPVVRLFKEVGSTFGSNQIGLVIVEDENIFDAGTLGGIQRITDTLSTMDGVLSVRSITNMMTFQSRGDDFQIDNLIRPSEWPQNAASSAALREEITANELVAGSLVAEDGTSTIILFYFANEADVRAIAAKVVDKVSGMDLTEKIYYGGSTFLTSYVADIIRTDMVRLIPIAFVLIALILFLSFRSWRGVAMPLLSAALAIVWAVGTFAMFGFKLSMVSNNVPIIVLAVGSAYAIHVFNRVQQTAGDDVRDRIRRAMTTVGLPVLLSGLTTVVGFTSFVFGAYLLMIRDFGILAALGTVYSTLLALFFVPAMLSILPDHRSKNRVREESTGPTFMERYFLRPMIDISTRKAPAIVLVWAILVAASIFGITRVERSVSVSDYFKQQHPASLADRIMEAKYGGSKPVYAVFRGDVQSPEVLSAMADFSSYLIESPYVTSTQSIADVVIKLNNALSETKGIPDEKSSIQQLWFFLGQQDLSQLINEDLDEAVIMAKFNNEGQANIAGFNTYVENYLGQLESDAYQIEVSGMPYVNARMDASLVRSQLTSLLLAVVLVILLVTLIFRSIRQGVIAALPIIATICILYGFMGFAAIPLNVATVLVASVAMGIGIDYSIHFISNFNSSMRENGHVAAAIENAILISGKAIFVNFISVAAGFLVLVFSDLMPMVYFGILIALSMLGSAMGALTLLPGILVLSDATDK